LANPQASVVAVQENDPFAQTLLSGIIWFFLHHIRTIGHIIRFLSDTGGDGDDRRLFPRFR
jgi:hypothetical protein